MRFAWLIASWLLLGCGPGGDADLPSPNRGDDGRAASQPEAGPVIPGAERLFLNDFSELEGLRVGLIANQTSRVGDAHLADLLHEHPRVDLAALFGPEHGLRGTADAGEVVEDGIDDDTGVPVYSLYGDRRAPEAETLADLDILVFDIQDIGARFYTYIATMGLSMDAAAEAGIPFMVLDRPNPLGGARVDGFVLEQGYESFVGPYPIPVQHGLTVGELARMIQGEGWLESARDLDLRIIPVEGWLRTMLWPDTGLPWIPTSPNIPTFETALVYPGMCFLEAADVNEGRGTERPFLWTGAPGMNADSLAARIEADGVDIRPHRYTPVSMPGRAASPRYQDREVSGVQVEVMQADAVRPLALGMEVLAGIVALQGTAVLQERWLDRLAGTDRLRILLERGASASEIVDSWSAEVLAFRDLRQSYLLYE